MKKLASIMVSLVVLCMAFPFTALAATLPLPQEAQDFIATYGTENVWVQQFGSNAGMTANNNPALTLNGNGITAEFTSTHSTPINKLWVGENWFGTSGGNDLEFIASFTGDAFYSVCLGIIDADAIDNYLADSVVSVSVNGAAQDPYTTATSFEENVLVIQSDVPITEIRLQSTEFAGLAYMVLSKGETPSLSLTVDPVGTVVRPGGVTLTAGVDTNMSGTLTFRANGEVIDTVTLPDNSVSFTPTTAENNYDFTVEYSGDATYAKASALVEGYAFTKGVNSDVPSLAMMATPNTITIAPVKGCEYRLDG